MVKGANPKFNVGVPLMQEILIIGLGGFTGAVLRYIVCNLIQNQVQTGTLAYETLAVNLIGCFLIGLLSQLIETHNLFSPSVRLFIITGFLGAFTTFSTFGNETLDLFRNGSGLYSLANIALHLGLGLVCIMLGRFSVSLWSIN
jgi:CrcB protein